MPDLAGFLLARIAEDEAVARGEREWMRERYPGEPDNDAIELQSDKDGWVNISDARVLAECVAKRRIVEEHTPTQPRWPTAPGCLTCGTGQSWDKVARQSNCTTLRLLAAPYADHEDYRESWRP